MWIPQSFVIPFVLLLSYATESTEAANPQATTISRANNGGTLACASENNPTWQQGDNDYFMSLSDANSITAGYFCDYLTRNPLALWSHPGNGYVYNASSFPYEAVDDPGWNRVWLSVRGDSRKVFAGREVTCSSLLGTYSTDWNSTCLDAMSTIINGCDTAKNVDSDYWKAGGTFTKECTTWQLYKTGSFI